MTEEIRSDTTPEMPENTPPVEFIEIAMPAEPDAEAARTPSSKRKDEPVITISATTLNYVVVALTFMVVGVLIGMSIGGRSNVNEAQMEQIIRNVMADMDLGQKVLDPFELVDDDPYIGEENAPIVIVEFSDFLCPFCGQHYDTTLAPLLENYGKYIRYVYRDMPIITQESRPAALAAGCANEQGAFWKFHNAFFEHQDQLGRAFYLQTAQDFGLDIDEYTKCLDEERYRKEITIDMADGQMNGVQGTPGFFVNGHFVRGAVPYEFFERLILTELAKAGIDPTQAS